MSDLGLGTLGTLGTCKMSTFVEASKNSLSHLSKFSSYIILYEFLVVGIPTSGVWWIYPSLRSLRCGGDRGCAANFVDGIC